MKMIGKIKHLGNAVLCSSLVITAVVVSAPDARAADFTTGGIECVSNNLQQAINSPIIWDGFRVRNESPSANRFVLCPIAHYTDFDDEGDVRSIAQGNVFIAGYFGASSAPGAEISCGVREIPVTDSGTPTSGDSVTITITADDALPDVNQEIVSLNGQGFALGVPIIASCQLPAGTGIQQLGVNILGP